MTELREVATGGWRLLLVAGFGESGTFSERFVWLRWAGRFARPKRAA